MCIYVRTCIQTRGKKLQCLRIFLYPLYEFLFWPLDLQCIDPFMVLQDWKTERYKEIIKSGTVRTTLHLFYFNFLVDFVSLSVILMGIKN